jgi:hypothetical protein
VQEVLVLIVIVLAIFYVPRLFGRKPAPVRTPPPPVLTGRLRLALLVTIFWLAGAAALLTPWGNNPLPFLLIGLTPVTTLWGAAWVWFGFKRYRR